MLTSHYMKDIEALCKRVVIIANGSIYHDGSLDAIVDRFCNEKIITLHLLEPQSIEVLQQKLSVLEIDPPKIKFRTARDEVGHVLSEILDVHPIEDLVVEDPPLEEVISRVYLEAEKTRQQEGILDRL